MSVYCDPDKDIIYHILNLLPTVEEALFHMKLQLHELRMEEGSELYQDVAEAISKIAYSLTLLKNIDKSPFQQLDKLTSILHKSMARMNETFEEENIIALQETLKQNLIPVFIEWRQKLENGLRAQIMV